MNRARAVQCRVGWIAVVLLLLLAPLVACGEAAESPPPTETITTETVVTPPPTYDVSPNGGQYGAFFPTAMKPADSQFCPGDVVLRFVSEGAGHTELLFMVVHPGQEKIGMPGMSIDHRIRDQDAAACPTS